MQLKVTNSPFTEEQAELINRVLPSLTETQIQWLGGYLAFYRMSAFQPSSEGAFTLAQPVVPVTTAAPVNPALNAGEVQQPAASALQGPTTDSAQAQIAATIEAEVQPSMVKVTEATPVISQPDAPRDATVLFGSQTGNAQRLAGKLASQLEGQGFEVTLAAMNNYKTNALKKAAHLFIIVSTHGEGDPPDNAIPFYEFLHSKRAPQLEGLKFSVLALGDTSYEFFCKTGSDFDQRLESLGAQRLTERVDCDLDYDGPAAEWFSKVLGSLIGLAGTTGAASSAGTTAAVGTAAVSNAAQAEDGSEYSRTNPFRAEVLTNINLNGRGSDRETRHLELSLEGSGLQYQPGDIVGIYPENDAALVGKIMETMSWNPKEPVIPGKNGSDGYLRTALLNHYEITVLTRPLLEKAAAFTKNGKLAELLLPENKQEFKDYIYGRDLLDLLQDFKPWNVLSSDFISILRKLPAREYSIASSNKANPDEVHLTIRKVQYESHGRERNGVCSVQTAERLAAGDTLPIFIKQNPNFKMPANPDVPVIMIGPGTGVAPFRAFLEEREEDGSEGKTWLFFGDRHFVTDFLYQTDWQRWLKEGTLTKLDVAFSRDTEEKVYVQHRMQEKASELYAWLKEGAHVYVCGDEKLMAHDVHATLLKIIEQEGGMSSEAAAAYLADMQQQQRYQRDVY